ncbi:MAG TPA: hypothetical protein PLI18_13830 [Pirellulaceae bacterium]|nr:hypothetical protein [Pirellulaceae bacterium]
MTASEHDDFRRRLDAWPPGSLDRLTSDDPELRAWIETEAGGEAWRRHEAEGAEIAARLADVPVPHDLAKRLRRRLRDLQNAEIANDDQRPRPLPSPDRPSRSGRRQVIGWLAASVVVLVAGSAVAWRFWWEPKPTGRTEVAQSSLGWAALLTSEGWQEVEATILKRAPVPEELGAMPRRCAIVATDFDRRTMVYDLSGPEGPLALLYVASADRRFALPDRFPLEPDYTTGRHAVGSMFRDGRLYVLLVEGDARRYRETLRGVGPLG